MHPPAAHLQLLLEATGYSEPAFPVYSNVTAQPHEPGVIARRLEEQVTSAVRWTETLSRLHAAGVTMTIEFGSGQVLTRLTGPTLTDVQPLAGPDPASLQGAPHRGRR